MSVHLKVELYCQVIQVSNPVLVRKKASLADAVVVTHDLLPASCSFLCAHGVTRRTYCCEGYLGRTY